MFLLRGPQPWRSKSFFKCLTSAHTCVFFLLSLPQTQPQEGCVWRSVLVAWKFTQLSKAAFPPAWKTPHICVPAWACSFILLTLVLSPWLRSRERAGLILCCCVSQGYQDSLFLGKLRWGAAQASFCTGAAFFLLCAERVIFPVAAHLHLALLSEEIYELQNSHCTS